MKKQLKIISLIITILLLISTVTFAKTIKFNSNSNPLTVTIINNSGQVLSGMMRLPLSGAIPPYNMSGKFYNANNNNPLLRDLYPPSFYIRNNQILKAKFILTNRFTKSSLKSLIVTFYNQFGIVYKFYFSVIKSKNPYVVIVPITLKHFPIGYKLEGRTLIL